MNLAMCAEDGSIFTAIEFAQQLPDDLERKRRTLQCPECGGPAFFRNASSIGRMACFGARPHADGCQLAAQDFVRLQGADDNQDAPLNFKSKIIVDLNYGSPVSNDADSSALRSRLEHIDYNHSGYILHETPIHRRLSSLLRDLLESPAFGSSDQVIKIDGVNEIVASQFFVPLLCATTQHSGLLRGFYGLLSDAKLAADQSLWLNSGGRDTISFCLDSKYLECVAQRYHLRDVEDIAGAYILVLGAPRVSQNGKLFLVINGPEYMALRLT